MTVIVRYENSKSITYSSWERYKALRTNNHELTSEILLKIEFVTILPETTQPQRCSISVGIDSALPLIQPKNREDFDSSPYQIFYNFRRDWQTVQISVDFVDFLIAKNFAAIVEEWFKTLKFTPRSILANFLSKHTVGIRSTLGQFGRLGMASFLAAYVVLSWRQHPDILKVTLAASVGLTLWAVFLIIENLVTPKIFKRVYANLIPSVILLTDYDQSTYDDVIKKTNSTTVTLLQFTLMILLNIFINVGSSYLYSYFSQPRSSALSPPAQTARLRGT